MLDIVLFYTVGLNDHICIFGNWSLRLNRVNSGGGTQNAFFVFGCCFFPQNFIHSVDKLIDMHMWQLFFTFSLVFSSFLNWSLHAKSLHQCSYQKVELQYNFRGLLLTKPIISWPLTPFTFRQYPVILTVTISHLTQRSTKRSNSADVHLISAVFT